MPKENCHHFVSPVQLETYFERSKVKRVMFSITAIQPNFVHGGSDHYHDRYSCYFGRHHIYCNLVDNFGARKTGVMDIE
eukprot:2003800-Ditylum_brightwellii.AAC.1